MDNVFWELVKEIYPLFSLFCLLLGIKRLAKGVMDRINGDEDAIGDALNDIVVGFFFLHMLLTIVTFIWYINKYVGSRAEEVVKEVFGQIGQNGGSGTGEATKEATKEAMKHLTGGK